MGGEFEEIFLVILVILQSPKIGNAKRGLLLQLSSEGMKRNARNILDEARRRKRSLLVRLLIRDTSDREREEKCAYSGKVRCISRRDSGEINKPGGGRETRFAWRRDHVYVYSVAFLIRAH